MKPRTSCARTLHEKMMKLQSSFEWKNEHLDSVLRGFDKMSGCGAPLHPLFRQNGEGAPSPLVAKW